MLIGALQAEEKRELRKLATAELDDVKKIQGSIAAYRSITRLLSPAVPVQCETENPY